MSETLLQQEIYQVLCRAKIKARVESERQAKAIWINEPNCRREMFRVQPETLQGVDGFIVLRYHPTGNTDWEWDEQYQFYRSLKNLANAIRNSSYGKGRRAYGRFERQRLYA